MEPVDLNQQILRTVELARPRWMDDSEAQGISIHVQTELGEIPPIQGNLGELSEVILLLNGVDALAEGGTVTVSTQQSADGFVSMSVTDTGIGMSD
jgi:signal transduction histidine kinase